MPEPKVALEASAEVEDHDAALGVIVFARLGDRSLCLFRQLEPRLLELVTSTLLLFPPPNLIHDERRQQRGRAVRAQRARPKSRSHAKARSTARTARAGF